MKHFLFYIAMLVLFACHSPSESGTQVTSQAPDSVFRPRYAKGFEIQYFKTHKILVVKNPYQGAKNMEFKYLIRRDSTLSFPQEDNLSIFTRFPHKVVCTSTTQIAPLVALGERDAIVGVSGAQYVSDSIVKKRVKAKSVKDVGYAPQYDFETLLHLNPDLMLIYGVDASSLADAKRLSDLHIPTVYVAEFLEESPLGKSEWIIFLSAFYDRETEALAFFHGIESRYLAIRAKNRPNAHKPIVMTGLPWQGNWMVNGADSYIAKLIEDAGGVYAWNFVAGYEAVPIELETVFEKAKDAEFWINISSAGSKSDIVALDARLAKLKAFKNNQLYNNIKRYTPGGGNEYWEMGIIRPDQILNDLSIIINQHTEQFDSMIFYTKLR